MIDIEDEQDQFAELLQEIESSDYEIGLEKYKLFIQSAEWLGLIGYGHSKIEHQIMTLLQEKPNPLELAGMCAYFGAKLYESMEG